MSLTEFLNRFFFQLLFVRLTKQMKRDGQGNYTIVSRYGFMYWVVPFTGWRSNFKYLGGSCNVKFLTKPK